MSDQNGKGPKIEQPSRSFMEDAVCLVLEMHRWGVNKRVASGAVETEADKSLLRIQKVILDCDEYDEIRKHDGRIGGYVRTVTLPSPMFRDGVYLVPLAMVDEVDGWLEEHIKEREPLVKAFIAVYDKKAREGRKRLGPLANLTDYPSARYVEAQFSVEKHYITFSTPGKLRKVSPALLARELDKARASVMQAGEEIKKVLRAGLLDLIEHASEKLKPKPDGSRQIFRDSMVTNINEFVDVFNAKNIVNDTDLAKIVERTRAVLKGIAPEQLRDSDQVREKAQAQFTEIKKSLDLLLVDRPKRKLGFGKEV